MSNLTDAIAQLEAAEILALLLRSARKTAYDNAVIGNSKQARLDAEGQLAAAESIVGSINAAQADLAAVT